MSNSCNLIKLILFQLRFVDIMRRHYRVIANLSNQCRNMLKTPYTKCLDIFDDAYFYCKGKARFFGSHGDACEMIQKTAKVFNQSTYQSYYKTLRFAIKQRVSQRKYVLYLLSLEKELKEQLYHFMQLTFKQLNSR